MKNIFKSLLGLSLMTMLGACAPQDPDNHSLESTQALSAETMTISTTTSTRSDNVIEFTNATAFGDVAVSEWDLGNGVKTRGNSAVGEYPQKGTYTVSLTMHTSNGASVTKSMSLNIEQDDYSLISTPAYEMLTGGADAVDGKVWVFDQYNLFTDEVKAAVGTDIRGHMGLGPLDSYSQGWWGANVPSIKENEGWEIYDMKMNFNLNGLKLSIEDLGTAYGRDWAAIAAGYNITFTSGADVGFDYAGGDFTFSISEAGKYPTLTVSDGAMLGYFCGTQVYEIIYQTESALALRVANSTEGQDWVLIFCLEELSVDPTL